MADFSNQIITIKKGLDLPIAGEPRQIIESGNKPSQVAILGEEYVGLKPTMLVEVGDKVKKGQPLFEDKKQRESYLPPPPVVKLSRLIAGIAECCNP
ncbi:Na(+)-translocating NADH-quinone reductase subunit A [Shewanella putrefaciens]|nr:Na(+)-translocating NADH-quinone reductase subunit A [Shewanella putrefaciens]